MDAKEKARICAAVNGSPQLKGVGIVHLDAFDQEILQRHGADAGREPTYLVLLAPPTDAKNPLPLSVEAVSGRLKKLGLNPTKVVSLRSSVQGFVVYIATTRAKAEASTTEAERLRLYQERMQAMNTMFEMLSSILKSMHDQKKALIQNLRG